MTIAEKPAGFGRHVYGLGVVALGAISLAWGDFDPGQTVPKDFPARTILAYAAAVFMIAAGAAVLWRRTAAWGAAALVAYFALIVSVLMDGPSVVAHYNEFGGYSNVAGQAAIAAGALVVFAMHGELNAAMAARLLRIGQAAFGICAILFGGAHFFYMDLTAPLVPAWLPPSQVFWGYATGAAHIAGGIAILVRVQDRLAAILLSVMYALFTPLVQIPWVMAHPTSHFVWSENAVNIVLTGVAWVVADSLARRASRE